MFSEFLTRNCARCQEGREKKSDHNYSNVPTPGWPLRRDFHTPMASYF